MQYAKVCEKPLKQQIDVVAQFHAHKIHPLRIAYRTGIAIELVEELVNGENHQRLFKRLLAWHKRQRYQQRLQASRRVKGIAQTEIQQQIEQEFTDAIGLMKTNRPA